MPTLVTRNSKRAIAGIGLLGFWLAVYAIHDLPKSTESWASLVPLRCPLSYFFDIACPTCGFGRSLVAAALGHGQESFHYHPFGLPIFWGSQALLLTWMLWPQGWEAVRKLGQSIGRNRLLLLFFITLYSLWGFCWRTPV